MAKKQNNITIQHIDTRLIVESPLNPRKHFSLTELQELSDSIKNQGLLQPITLRPVNEKDLTLGYEIVCGARRFKASQLAEMKQIPAIVRVMTDEEAFDAMITENLQRKDVEPIDEAIAFKALLDKGASFEELAARFGKSQQFIRQRIKLNDLVPELSEMMQNKDLHVSHAQELCKLEVEEQNEIFGEHYSDDASSYYSWKGITTKELKERLANRFNDLDNETFDKSDCINCQHRCGANILFQEFEANTCVNSSCFENKKKEQRIKITIEKLNAGFIILYQNKEDDVSSDLIEQGYELSAESLFTRHYTQNEPSIWHNESEEDFNARYSRYEKSIQEMEDKVTKGEIKRGWLIRDYGDQEVFISAKTTISSDGTKEESESIAVLQDKDKRNKEIQNEKTIADLRELISESDYDTNTEPLSENEVTAMYASILMHCDYRFRDSFLENKSENILSVISELSEDDKNKMIRNFIKDMIDDSGVTYCESRQEILKLVSTESYPAETKGIELKHEETYLKRKEKIDQQIKAIEA